MTILSPSKYAFSLVELSIVLVILGLLTGGILAGRSLVRAAEIRSVGVDYQRYVTAVQSFRDKYFAIPGDMNNATSFWGAVSSNNFTCYDTISTDSKTCDGDGNGQLDSGANAASNGNNNYYTHESYRFWQHLANAGLIAGQYSGVRGDRAGYSTAILAGSNTPLSKIANASFRPQTTDSSTSGLYTMPQGTWAQFTTNADNNSGVLRGEDAWNIDTKFDDGKYGSGMIMGEAYPNGARSYCPTRLPNSSMDTNANTQYRFSQTPFEFTCVLWFKFP